MSTTRAIFPAVLPAPPPVYDQLYFARLVDVLTKMIEQLQQPRHIVAGSLTLTDLEDGDPRTDIPGEVYSKLCAGCVCRVLAIKTKVDPP
jgi:hypothetical protein